MNSKIMQLEEYAELEGSEIGESCMYLISLYRRRDYLSNHFINAVELEIDYQLDNFKENCRVVERESTHKYIIKELEWIF